MAKNPFGNPSSSADPTQKQVDLLTNIMMGIIIAGALVIAGWIITLLAAKAASYQDLAKTVAIQGEKIDAMIRACNGDSEEQKNLQPIINLTIPERLELPQAVPAIESEAQIK